jgi:hypothetical protein
MTWRPGAPAPWSRWDHRAECHLAGFEWSLIAQGAIMLLVILRGAQSANSVRISIAIGSREKPGGADSVTQ